MAVGCCGDVMDPEKWVSAPKPGFDHPILEILGITLENPGLAIDPCFFEVLVDLGICIMCVCVFVLIHISSYW